MREILNAAGTDTVDTAFDMTGIGKPMKSEIISTPVPMR